MVTTSTLDDLLAQRDGVYATLRDLELDRQLGKLDGADHDALREKYMARASEILRELDRLRGEGGGAANAAIEQEVAALRKSVGKGSAPGGKDERRETKTNRRGALADSAAQHERREGSNVTSQTSTGKRSGEERFCANCGRPYTAGDKFCARCGHALA